jgi:hypothetical protein
VENLHEVKKAPGDRAAQRRDEMNKCGDYLIAIESGHQFLEALDPKAEFFAFQTFDDNKSRRDRRLARTLHGTLDKLGAALEDLNRRGAGIFVTVNDIRLGCERKIQNLGRIRAVWQDDDIGWSGDYPLMPSAVVQSSPGKFQRYWLVDGLSPEEHQAVMRRLVASYGADANVHDLVRVLRLPGFYHMKNPKQPQFVELFEAPGWVYSAEQILEAFPPIWPEYYPPARTNIDRTHFARREFAQLLSALSYIPADDRMIWFRVGAALKLEFGDAARSIWDGWSATSEKFDPRTQHTVWKSIRRGTGVTLGTVFYLARENGYREGHHA